MNEPAAAIPSKTLFARPATVRGDWYVIDASGKTLGRLASQIAHRLKGKHKADYSPHVDMGDHIVIVNAEKIRVTGRKLTDKIYYHHTGYIGGIKSIALEKLLDEHPERAIEIRGEGHAAEEPARPAHVPQAARVRRRRASAQGAAAQAPRDSVESIDMASAPQPHYGTGRRKTATARVYLAPGERQDHRQ